MSIAADLNIFRSTYKELSAEASAEILALKNRAEEFWNHLHSLTALTGATRELSVAKTKLEEVVMWATKHLSS